MLIKLWKYINLHVILPPPSERVRDRLALYIMYLCMATKERNLRKWVFPWKMKNKKNTKIVKSTQKKKKCTLLIFTRHDVIFAMIYSFMWVNRVACISRQKCETLIARKYPFNETSEMIYVVDDVLLDVVCVGDGSLIWKMIFLHLLAIVLHATFH